MISDQESLNRCDDELAASAVTEIMPPIAVKEQAVAKPSHLQRAWKIVSSLCLYLVLVLCVQAPVLAILLLGWFYAWMRLRGLRAWFFRLRRSDTEKPTKQAFAAFLSSHADELGVEARPRFFSRAQYARKDAATLSQLSFFKRCCYYLSLPVANLWTHARIGVQGWMNLSVFLIPVGLFWSFGWWGGWNNSFYKGYESYAVGQTLGVAGIALFVLAMTYIPMAQARQAMTGQWRSFWDIALVRLLVAERPIACLLLALCIACLNLPVIIFKTLPFQFSEMIVNYEQMTRAELLDFSQAYFFYTGIYVLLAFFLIKNLAMRIYANAVLRLLAKGRIAVDDLDNSEQLALERIGITHLMQIDDAHWKRVVRWPLRASCCVALLLVWFGFAAQIFVAQFLKYDSNGYGKGWVNQPLIQVPWFNYTPAHLHTEEADVVNEKFLAR